MQSRVFVSHASEDKTRYVRPLVQALAIEGVKLWLDRPGFGDSHFNFDASFIRRYDIEALRSGLPWDQQILDAHFGAGAVLGCLSSALCPGGRERLVLVQELVLAKYAKKLVACIVDDLPYSKLPSELGLIDASKLQAPRIDTASLQKAVFEVDSGAVSSPDELAPPLRSQWQIVRQLVVDINRLLVQTGNWRPSATALKHAQKAVEEVPIGPMVRVFEIPLEVILFLSEHFHEPTKSREHVALAMQLVIQCNHEGFDMRQIVVTAGEVVSADTNTPEAYWSDVLTVAGRKSRRTLAALLLAPGLPDLDELPSDVSKCVAEFRAWLHQPTQLSIGR